MSRPPVLHAFMERHTAHAQSPRLAHPTLRPLSSRCVLAACTPRPHKILKPLLHSTLSTHELLKRSSRSPQQDASTWLCGPHKWRHLLVWLAHGMEEQEDDTYGFYYCTATGGCAVGLRGLGLALFAGGGGGAVPACGCLTCALPN
jgi:hypothetical protein